MEMLTLFLVLPLAIYLVIVVMPEGRPARWALLLTGVPLVALWFDDLFDAGRFFTGDPQADAFAWLALGLGAGAWVLGALVQIGGRALVARWPVPGGYGLLAACAPLLFGVPLMLLPVL
ncbi:MAG: hypothetical protein WCZ72_06325 [Gemmobacter sp.]